MIDAAAFKAATGFYPKDDDLERSNCPKAGQPNHTFCGWNASKNMPVFWVGAEPAIAQPKCAK